MIPPSFNLDYLRTISPSMIVLYDPALGNRCGCTSYYNTSQTEHSSPLRTGTAIDCAIFVLVLATVCQLHLHW